MLFVRQEVDRALRDFSLLDSKFILCPLIEDTRTIRLVLIRF